MQTTPALSPQIGQTTQTQTPVTTSNVEIVKCYKIYEYIFSEYDNPCLMQYKVIIYEMLSLIFLIIVVSIFVFIAMYNLQNNIKCNLSVANV